MIYSVIDIGSAAVYLKVVSSNRGKLSVIDEIATEIGIGKEVYSSEYISHDSVSILVSVFHSYRRIMDDYRVDAFKVIATGALGNAKNASQVIEIVRMKTGFEIEILDSPVENYITYKALRDKIKDYEEIRQGAVIVDTHSGSTDITVYSKGRLISNDTIKLGSQIAVPYIEKVIAMVGDYPRVIADYISTLTRRAQKKVINRSIEHLLLLGNSAVSLSHLFFEDREEITADEFLKIYKKIIQKDYELEKKAGDKWVMVLFTVILCAVFLEATNAQKIYIPNISLSDGMITDMVERRSKSYDEDIFDAATEIARRFKCKLRHIRNVESNTQSLFDALYKRLDMDLDDAFILRLAVHLVEIGKSLRRSGYERASVDMLKHLDIFGVGREILDEIGYIALEIENIFSNDSNRIIHTVRTRKIAMILAIGMALDINNLQHIKIGAVLADEENEEFITVEMTGSDFTSTKIALEPVQEAFLDCLGYELRIVEDLCC